jgi:hypothetical protein
MSSRRWTAVLGIAALFLVIGALFLTVGRPGVEKRSFSKVTVNLQNSWLNSDDVYYYTGSFFAKYNTGTGSIERLSDYLFIKDGISSVSWSPDAVVFQTNPTDGTRDDVTTAAQQLGVRPYQPHWWKYDFQTKQYQLLALPGIDNCGSLVQISSGLLACLAPQTSGNGIRAIKTFDLASKSSRNIFSTDDGVSSISSDGQNLYFIVSSLSGAQSLHSVNLSSASNKELFSSKNQLAYYAYGGGKVLVDESSARTGKIEDSHEGALPAAAAKQKVILLENGEKTFDKTVKLPPVTFYSDPAGDMLLSSLDGSISEVSGTGIKTIVGPATPSLAGGDFLFQAHNKLYVINPKNELLSSPATPRTARYPSDFSTKNDNDKAGNSFIDVASGGVQSAYIFIPNVSSSQQELAIGNMLEQKGFKPSEFNFDWKPDSVGFHAPITPNAVIIK